MKDNLDLQAASRLWGPIETETRLDAADLWEELDPRDMAEAAELFPLGLPTAADPSASCPIHGPRARRVRRKR